jgi:hypothetical protein
MPRVCCRGLLVLVLWLAACSSPSESTPLPVDVDAVGAVDIEPDLAQDTVLVDLAQDTAVADLDDPETQPAPLWQLGKQ